MLSDLRIVRALSAVAPAHAAYHTAAIASLERLRAMLNATDGADHARTQLGALGAAHIDVQRFAALARSVSLDTHARATITRATDILRYIVDATPDDFVIDVPPGVRPRHVIASALAGWGRAFAAASAADLARAARYDESKHAALLDTWPFERWTKAERRRAPALVVTVAGADVRVGDLGELLDEAAHIVLVVLGDCAPAPLARLITPATFVLQTHDERGLDRFSAYQGPAIAALMPESAAAFMHDPALGHTPWQRLAIWRMPDAPVRKPIGGASPAQQQQELLQLQTLATPPTLPIGVVDTLAPPDTWDGSAADRLTAWLLAQAGSIQPTQT